MEKEYIVLPTTPEGWKQLALNFEKRWQYPHCLGAIDGKHVNIVAPKNSGSWYYSYKHTFSMILMAVVDANYKFISIDVGSYGRHSDSTIFAISDIGKALAPPNTLNLPVDEVIEGAEALGPMPYVMVGDEAFPLQRHIMRPYPGRGITRDREIHNLRLSRARRVVENAFGILAARWRVYHTKIAVLPDTLDKIVLATCVLHNMLQNETTPAMCQNLLDDGGPMVALTNLRPAGNRGANEAVQIRDRFQELFVTHNPVTWQEDRVDIGRNVDLP